MTTLYATAARGRKFAMRAQPHGLEARATKGDACRRVQFGELDLP